MNRLYQLILNTCHHYISPFSILILYFQTTIEIILTSLHLNLRNYYNARFYPCFPSLLAPFVWLINAIRYHRYYRHSRNRAKSTYCLKYHSNFVSGFTLVELIVTVSILAIIAVFAIPVILSQLADMEAKRIRYKITNTLAVAKAESSIRRRDLLLCLANSNGRCNKDGTERLLLFVDVNDNQHFDVNVDSLIEEQHLNSRYGTLHLRASLLRHYVKFAGDNGKPIGHFGHIKYCPSSIYNKSMYQISFNKVGIIKYKPNDISETGCAD